MSISLTDFAAKILSLEEDMRAAQEATVVKGCRLVQRKAKAMIGTPQPGLWPPLQPATIERKRKGDTPLLETGELRASIEMSAPHDEGKEVVGYVGSNNPKAVWHEFGTGHVPPRPFLSSAAAACEHEIHEIAHREVGKAIAGGKAFGEWKHVFHLLHRAYDNIKEALPEDENEK